MTNQKSRVVFDTNVWLSALVFGGRPDEVLQLFIDGSITVVVSEECLSELRRKLVQKFPLFLLSLNLLEASIRKDAELVQLGRQPVQASRDKTDDKFIETALIGHCSYIISGDNDLLTLKHYQNISIVSSSEFLELFKP